MNLPKRKPNRLKNFDYSTPNAYFVTICTNKRKKILWRDVGASIARPQDVQLSPYGQIVDAAVRNIPVHYPAITVEHYVIMPNHVHLLLQIHSDTDGRGMLAPTKITPGSRFGLPQNKQTAQKRPCVGNIKF